MAQEAFKLDKAKKRAPDRSNLKHVLGIIRIDSLVQTVSLKGLRKISVTVHESNVRIHHRPQIHHTQELPDPRARPRGLSFG